MHRYGMHTILYYSVLYKPGCLAINQGCILLETISSKRACYTFLSVNIFWEKLSKGCFNHKETAASSLLSTQSADSAQHRRCHTEPFAVKHFYGSVAPIQLCRYVPLFHISGQFDKHYHRTQHVYLDTESRFILLLRLSRNCCDVANQWWCPPRAKHISVHVCKCCWLLRRCFKSPGEGGKSTSTYSSRNFSTGPMRK